MKDVSDVTFLAARGTGRGGLRRAIVGSTVALATLAAALPALAAPKVGVSGSTDLGRINASISSTETQVGAMEAQVAAEQRKVTALSEQYDQASVHLQQVRDQLAATEARLVTVRQQRDAARHALQVAAVNAYIFDTPIGHLDALFASSPDTALIREEYQRAAIGDINRTVREYQTSEQQLAATQSALRGQEQQASDEAVAVRQAQQSAQAAGQAAQATLSQVKGQLAQFVAQRAAKEAAAAAAVAAAAASEAARRQAAAQAAQAAQVAETVAGGSAAATDAINAANQAAASAGATGTVGTGAPESPSGAGAVALREAERFLGVPYQWGGADARGVDCSGLTMLAWRAAGVGLVHSAAIQYGESTHIQLSQVQPGDLLFYDLDGTGIDHVVMYVGSGPFGASTIIQAAHTGTVVEFDPVWYGGLVGAGRP